MLADRDGLLTVEMIDRASMVGLDPCFAMMNARRGMRGNSLNIKKGVHGGTLPPVVDEQLESFMARQEVWLPESWITCNEDEMDELSARDRVLSIKFPHAIFEPTLTDISSTRPALFAILKASNVLEADQKLTKRAKSRRQRRQEDRFLREQYASKTFDASSSYDQHGFPSEKTSNLMGCVVAKAIADSTVDSYLIASFLLFNHYRKDKSSMLPVNNLLASLFEGTPSKSGEFGQASTAFNPFHLHLLSAKDDGTKSVSCRSDVSEYVGIIDESIAGLQSDAGSTIESNNADIGTETASVVEAEMEELTEDEVLTHALAMSISVQSVPRTNSPTASPAATTKSAYSSFSICLEASFWAELNVGEGGGANQSSVVPILHVIAALLMCVSGSLDLCFKGIDLAYHNSKFPSLSSTLLTVSQSNMLQLCEAFLRDLLAVNRGDDMLHSSSSPLLTFLPWSMWLVCRMTKIFATSLFDDGHRCDESTMLHQLDNSNQESISVLGSLHSYLSSALGFNPVEMSEITSIANLNNSQNFISVKLMMAEALASLYCLDYSDDIVKLFSILRATIQNAPSYEVLKASQKPTTFFEIYFVHKLCLNIVDNVLLSFKHSGYLRNRESTSLLFPKSFDDLIGVDTGESIEELLLKRLGDTNLVSNSTGAANCTQDEVLYFGELSLLKVLQQTRLKIYNNWSYDEGEDHDDLRINPRRCSPTLKILGDQKECLHLGPKSWATAVASFPITPKSGTYEFSVRIEKCDKGHVFVGLVSGDASVDTYVGGDKHGFGMIGTRAGMIFHLSIFT